MQKTILTILLNIFFVLSIAQNTDLEFKDGIYLNFNQVKTNSPITREQIITDIEKDDIDFYEKLLEQDYIKFIDKGITKTIEVNQIWGFCDEGSLYIHFGNDFAKLIAKGFLGYFIATQIVSYYDYPYYNTYYYDPYYNYQRTSKEMRHYIIDFASGKIYEFNPKNLAFLLKLYDTQLYNEYINLSKRKQKKLIFYYLRLFNKRNLLSLQQKKS